MNLLEEARIEINEIDDQIVKLFERRMCAVKKVVTYKMEKQLPIFDEQREKANIERNVAKLTNKDLETYFLDFYQHMMDVSKNFQKDIMNHKK